MSFRQTRSQGFYGANRLRAAMEKYRPRVQALSAEKKKDLEGRLSLTPTEHFEYQNVQAWANATGVINTDEALTIYNALNDWDRQDLETKVVVTQTLAELAKAKIVVKAERP